MTTITLESIQAEQSRVNSMIDAFVKQTRVTEFRIHETYVDLAPGERYAGIVLNDAGKPSHHLILRPGTAEDVSHEDAMAWAERECGELPTRQEQALLYANLKGAFQARAYWSAETYAEDSSYAWYQGFGYGYQDSYLKSAALRAVAVRRLVIE